MPHPRRVKAACTAAGNVGDTGWALAMNIVFLGSPGMGMRHDPGLYVLYHKVSLDLRGSQFMALTGSLIRPARNNAI